jgi:hypothetical protein
MHKPDGNRTPAHSGGNALDRTVPHVARYLLAALPHLIVRTDAADPSAHHSNQVTPVFLSRVGRREFLSSISRVPAHSSQRMLPCLPLFAVHTGAWPVARFGARAFGEFLVRRRRRGRPLHRGGIRARQIPNLSKFSEIFSAHNPIDLFGGEVPPGKPGPPPSRSFQKNNPVLPQPR